MKRVDFHSELQKPVGMVYGSLWHWLCHYNSRATSVTCYPRIISAPFNPKQQQLEKHGFGLEKGKNLALQMKNPPQKKMLGQ